MALFRKKKPLPPPGPPHTDPFLAVAHLDPEAQVRKDANGHLRIRRELPDRPGLSEFLARTLGFRRALRINLDERGTFFWNQVDGKRSLGEIEKRVRRHYELEAQESKDAIIVYTKELLLRHLLHLELPHIKKEEPFHG